MATKQRTVVHDCFAGLKVKFKINQVIKVGKISAEHKKFRLTFSFQYLIVVNDSSSPPQQSENWTTNKSVVEINVWNEIQHKYQKTRNTARAAHMSEGWGYPLVLSGGTSPRIGPWQEQGKHLPLWTDKQTENSTFPHTTNVGGNNQFHQYKSSSLRMNHNSVK